MPTYGDVAILRSVQANREWMVMRGHHLFFLAAFFLRPEAAFLVADLVDFFAGFDLDFFAVAADGLDDFFLLAAAVFFFPLRIEAILSATRLVTDFSLSLILASRISERTASTALFTGLLPFAEASPTSVPV